MRHFDLQLFGFDQIQTGHPKAGRGHLLDGAVLAVAQIVLPGIAIGVFATFAGIALAADPVHRHGQRLMRFLADRAIAHCAGLKAFDDLIGRFHFLERNRSCNKLEIEQRPQGAIFPFLSVDQGRILFKDLVALGLHVCAAHARRVLQLMYRLRVEQMALALGPPLIHPADRQHLW